jgi:hypothetical protein
VKVDKHGSGRAGSPHPHRPAVGWAMGWNDVDGTPRCSLIGPRDPSSGALGTRPPTPDLSPFSRVSAFDRTGARPFGVNEKRRRDPPSRGTHQGTGTQTRNVARRQSQLPRPGFSPFDVPFRRAETGSSSRRQNLGPPAFDMSAAAAWILAEMGVSIHHRVPGYVGWVIPSCPPGQRPRLRFTTRVD